MQPRATGEAMDLSGRHKREIEYHRRRAAEFPGVTSQPLDRLAARSHRWWNAYSVILRKAITLDLSNKRLLVIGSGFDNDAIFA